MTEVKYCGLKTVEDYLLAWHLGVQYAGFMCYEKSPRHIEATDVAKLLWDARSLAKGNSDLEGKAEPKTVGLMVDMDVQASVCAILAAKFDIIQVYNAEVVNGIFTGLLDELADSKNTTLMPSCWAVHRISSKQELDDIQNIYSLRGKSREKANQNDADIATNTTNTTKGNRTVAGSGQYGQATSGTRGVSQVALHPTRVQGVVLDNYSTKALGGTGTKFNWQWLEGFSLPIPYFIAGGINLHTIDELLAYRPYGVDISSGIEQEKGTKDHRLMNTLIEKIRRADGTS